jgi:molecular chaperone DnaJ
MDLYDVLQVGRDACADQIRRAYHKQALRLHPDKTGGDASGFQDVTLAYDVLSNPDRKRRYDVCGATDECLDIPSMGRGVGVGVTMNMGMGMGMGMGVNLGAGVSVPLHDFMRGMFFGSDTVPADVREVVLEPKEWYLGTTKRLHLHAPQMCVQCDGTGAYAPSDVIECVLCDGSGCGMAMMLPGMMSDIPCVGCSGQGRMFRHSRRCAVCHGSGAIPPVGAQSHITLSVPAGVQDGARVTLPGRGGFDARTRKDRDLQVTLHRKMLPNLHIGTAPGELVVGATIDLADVLCGYQMDVDVCDSGVVVRVDIPEYRPPTQDIVFSGKGLPIGESTGAGHRQRPEHQSAAPTLRGDLRVRLTVKYPDEHHPDAKQLGRVRDLHRRLLRRGRNTSTSTPSSDAVAPPKYASPPDCAHVL